eukprot:839253-Pyramimonas_sp.AAC.2
MTRGLGALNPSSPSSPTSAKAAARLSSSVEGGLSAWGASSGVAGAGGAWPAAGKDELRV